MVDVAVGDQNEVDVVEGDLLAETPADLLEPLDQFGVFENFLANFQVTYGGDTLTSLDLADAQGTYAYDGLTVFNWTVDDGGFNAIGIDFTEMTIGTPGLLFADGFESGNTSEWSSTVGR